MDLPDQLDRKVFRDHLVLQVLKVFRELQDRRVIRGLQV
jgi:hypothetical protein